MSSLNSNNDFTPDCVRNDSAVKRSAAKTLRFLLTPVLRFLDRRCDMCGALLCGGCVVELTNHPTMQKVCDGCDVEYPEGWGPEALVPDWLREDAADA